MDIILKPFCWLLLIFYRFAGYGVALILFGFVVKLILFPVTLKQKKSMIQMNLLSGRMQKLQAQYAKTNPEKYNEEVQKLYAQEHVNPMGGCMWSLVPMVVLIALYRIIRMPIQMLMNVPKDMVAKVAEITGVANTGAYPQIAMAKALNDPDILAKAQAALGDAGKGLFSMNFSFLGLDLDAIPTWKFWEGGIHWATLGLFLLVLISTAVSFLSMKVSMATNKVNSQSQNEQMDKTNQSMMLMMPLMSLWIGFTVPAGLSVYWISQYLMTMVQEVVCGKMLKKDYEAARAAAAEAARLAKEEEKRRKEEARLERARRLEEEKLNKKKGIKKNEEPAQEGVNRDDSREGIRAYARGRAYIPNRFGEVTEYADPNDLFRARTEAAAAAAEAKKNKKAKKAEKEELSAAQEQTAPVEEKAAESQQAVSEELPAEKENTASAAPAQPVQTEEVEVEVEQEEVELPDNDEKEGV